MTGKWRLSTLIRCFGSPRGATQQAQQLDAQLDVVVLCARIEALERRIEVLERENALLRDEVEAGRAREVKLLDVVSRGLRKASKGKRRKGKKGKKKGR